MKKGKIFLTLLLSFAICICFKSTAFASESITDSAKIENESSTYGTSIGSRVGYGESYGRDKVYVYVTLNTTYPNGITMHGGAVGNNSLYACSVIYPDGTVRSLVSHGNNLYANGDMTPFINLGYGQSGTYTFIFDMADPTPNTGCMVSLYETTYY